MSDEMCGIAGAIDLRGSRIPALQRRLEVMGAMLDHRGPDDRGIWIHARGHVGFAHRRLSIIDLDNGHQPMGDEAGRWVTYNGEIYNHPELRGLLSASRFRTHCDTETLLRAHDRWGVDSLERLRGMFAFGLWDEPADELVCARDRFGIKPLYYTQIGEVLYFASEAKALLPFLPRIETDLEGLKDYLAFQLCLGGKTLFKGIRELPPGHLLRVAGGAVHLSRYWDVFYDLDWDHSSSYFEKSVARLLDESVRLHLRSDVPVGAYVSGGLDSSAVAALASQHVDQPMKAFTGKFSEDPAFDESRYAGILARERGLELTEVDIDVSDFIESIEQVIYHLDYPAAGPGSVPQFMVSKAASHEVKVILGGQGGDEVFGGYARYLIAYFEQCIKAAIDGTSDNGNFVVTYESIIPNLVALRNYKPLLQDFWRDGLFDDLDARYFRLINRATELDGEVDLQALGDYSPFDSFREIFNGSNVGHESYFDKMTHFDFKTLLPALLHVEDRMSMAHGLESRVPLLDHELVEFAATIPADSKFRDGHMKHVFHSAVRSHLPSAVAERTDKMGFPVPLNSWMVGEARDWVRDVFTSESAQSRSLIDNRGVADRLEGAGQFGRKVWGLLSLELWQRRFHDREHEFKALMAGERTQTP